MREKSVSVGYSRRDVLQFAAASTWRLPAVCAESVASGDYGPLRSAGRAYVWTDNVLLVGDIGGAKIHAFAMREKEVPIRKV